jgi:hypothetical protein
MPPPLLPEILVDEKPLLGVGVALTNGVAYHHDGGPVGLQQELAGGLLQQPVEGGRRAPEHFCCIPFFPSEKHIPVTKKLFLS